MATQRDATSSLEPVEQSTEVDLHPPKRRRSLMFCEHCDRDVSNSTYYRHREAYFNCVTGQWQQEDNKITSEADELESLGSEGNHYEGTRILYCSEIVRHRLLAIVFIIYIIYFLHF